MTKHEVIVAHSSPADLRATYVGLFGEPAVGVDGDSLIVTLGADRISFLAPEAFRARFPSVPVAADLSRGWFAGATLRVRSPDRVAGILAEAGIAAARTPSGSIVVAPSEAADTLLEFAAA